MHANKPQKRQISVETALRELIRLAEQSAASEEEQSKFGLATKDSAYYGSYETSMLAILKSYSKRIFAECQR